MRRTRITLFLILAAAAVRADQPADKAEPKAEHKAEHAANAITIKRKDKSGKWQTERECRLMFANNRKAKEKAK